MQRAFSRNLTGWTFVAIFAAMATLVGAWWWRRWRLPVHHRQIHDSASADPETPSRPGREEGQQNGQGGAPIQIAPDGQGPLYHRHYRADIAAPQVDAPTLMAQIQGNLNDFSPLEVARFEKTNGTAGTMREGDEYDIHLSAPWDAPVRVLDATPTSFVMATLDKHMEAGEIHFVLQPHPERDDALRFEIESWARSRDAVVDTAYDKIGIAKLGQEAMWTFFCQRVVEASGGTLIGDIEVTTEEQPVDEAQAKAARESADGPLGNRAARLGSRWWSPSGGRQKQPLHERYAERLHPLADADPNFDYEQRETFTEGTGWRIDDYQGELPAEPPGEPVAGGSWETAVDIMRRYEFPDPGILTGIYVPDDGDDLLDRTMLLRAKFLFFRFYFGVRISNVVDETRDTELGPARVWGFSYYTLEGHWEQGEIEFTVWKFLETGAVEFRIHAYSKTGRIPNLIYRIGFVFFGRWLQVRFSRKAVERMQALVATRAKVDTTA